jgi:hypothetical protein
VWSRKVDGIVVGSSSADKSRLSFMDQMMKLPDEKRKEKGPREANRSGQDGLAFENQGATENGVVRVRKPSPPLTESSFYVDAAESQSSDSMDNVSRSMSPSLSHDEFDMNTITRSTVHGGGTLPRMMGPSARDAFENGVTKSNNTMSLKRLKGAMMIVNEEDHEEKMVNELQSNIINNVEDDGLELTNVSEKMKEEGDGEAREKMREKLNEISRTSLAFTIESNSSVNPEGAIKSYLDKVDEAQKENHT